MSRCHEAKNKRQKEFYNSINPEYLVYQKNIPYARYIVSKIVSFLSRNDEILEIGSGQGRFTLELAKYGKQITATDISKKEIILLANHAEKLKIINIKTKVYDVFTKGNFFPNRKFDHIIGFFILHHLDRTSYELAVGNIIGHLKKKGTLIFIEPNNLYPFHIIQMMIEKDMSWEIEKGIYTNYLRYFKKACVNKGLSLKIFEKFGFIPPPFINKWPFLIKLDGIVAKIPIINQIFCPFILISVQL